MSPTTASPHHPSPKQPTSADGLEGSQLVAVVPHTGLPSPEARSVLAAAPDDGGQARLIAPTAHPDHET